MAGKTIETTDDRPPEPLADGLRSVRFAYRANPSGEEPVPWQPQWDNPEALPLQVRVQIADKQGSWPDLVVALPQAASYGVAAEQGK